MSTSVSGLNSKFHQNMIATAGKRNLMLIAEGVEEDDMLHSLKSFGYNFVQGFNRSPNPFTYDCHIINRYRLAGA